MSVEINCSPFCSGWSLVARPVVSGALVDPGPLPHRTERSACSSRLLEGNPGKVLNPQTPSRVGCNKAGQRQLHVMTIIMTPKCICSPPAHQHNKHQVKPKSLCYYRSPRPDAMQTRPNNPGKVQPKPNINAPPRELVTWLAPPFFSFPHPFSLFPNTNLCPTKPACILLFINDN